MYNGILGDYYLNLKDYSEAEKHYIKSIEEFDYHHDSLLDFKLSYIYTLLQLSKNDEAIKEFDSIDENSLSFGSKNKYDLFKNILSYNVK